LFGLLKRLRKWPFHRLPAVGSAELDAHGNAIGHEKDSIPLTAAFKTSASNAVEADSKSDIEGYYRPELAGSDGTANKSELAGSGGHTLAGKNELPGVAVHRPGDSTNELYGSHVASEVEGSRVIMELPGSPVGTEYFNRGPSQDLSPHDPNALSPRSPRSPLMGPVSSSDLISSSRGRSPSSVGAHSSRGRGSRTPVSPPSPSSRSGSMMER
jgi:hypothetical protein